MKTATFLLVYLFGPFLALLAWIAWAPEEWAHAVGRRLIVLNNVLGIGVWIYVWIYGGFYLVDLWRRRREARDCEHLQTVTKCARCGRMLLGDFRARGTL